MRDKIVRVSLIITCFLVLNALFTPTSKSGVFADDLTNIPVIGVTLNSSERSILKGQTYTLVATILPDNATNKNVLWSSSDEDVATVNNGVVNGVSVGTAVITATTEDGSYNASCNISVYEKHKNDLPIYDEDVTLEYVASNISVSGSGQLSYGLSPYEGDMVFLKDDTKTYKEKRGAITVYHNPEIYGYVKPFFLKDDAVITVDFSSTDSNIGISTKNITSTASHTVTNTWCGYNFRNFSDMFIKPSADGKYRLKGGIQYSVYIYRDNAEELIQGKYSRKTGNANAYISYKYEHTFGDWIITKEPTCEEDGVHEKKCSGCNCVVSETMPALGYSSSIFYTRDSYSLTTGESTTIYLSDTSSDALRWATTDSKVVSIENYSTKKAVIKATGKGEASIIAIDEEGKGIECSITVALNQLSISKTDVFIGVGNTFSLTVTGSKDISWKSSNTDIVSIDSSDLAKDTIKLSAEGLGEAVITAMDPYGANVSCNVKVLESYIQLDTLDVTLKTREKKIVYVKSGIAASAESSNNDIVSVNCYSGSVKLIAGDQTGVVDINVTEKNGAIAVIHARVESYIEVDHNNIDIDLEGYKSYQKAERKVMVTDGTAKDVYVENVGIATAELLSEETYLGTEQYIKIVFQSEIGETDIIVTEVGGSTANIHIKATSSFEISKNSIMIDYTYDEYYYGSEGYYGPMFEFVRYPDSNLYGDEFSSGMIYPKKGIIEKVTSLDEKIVRLKESYGTWQVYPVGKGIASIECEDRYGQKKIITIEVTSTFVDDYIRVKSKFGAVKYGMKQAKGKVLAGAAVKIYVNGKKCKCITKNNGSYLATIPVKKIGTRIKYVVSYTGVKYTKKQTIKKSSTRIKIPMVYKYTKNIKVTFKNVHKGDKATVKVGRRKFVFKIKKDKKAVSYKIKNTGNAGTKITIKVMNKYKQSLKAKTTKIYYASTIKKGMTKAQCKLVPWWCKPDDVTHYTNGDIWYYNDNSWIAFKHGKVVGWYSA